MRIAILIDSLASGGAERQALNATAVLRDLGHEATLLYYRKPGQTAAIERHPALDAGWTEHVPRRGGAAAFVMRLAARLRTGRFDVLHGFKSIATLYAVAGGRLAGVPTLIGGCRSEYDDEGAVRLAHRITRGLVQTWVVNSEAAARSLQPAIGVPRELCHVVPNGVDFTRTVSSLSGDEARRRLDLPADAPTVTCLAMFRRQKNHPLLLQAAALLRERKPEVRILLAGDGPERHDLEKLARTLNVADRVHFLGSRPDVADLLAASTVTVLTSDYEGTSNSLIESMGAGVPVVSTDYPGASELVSDGIDGFLTPRGDPAALADRLLRLIQDYELRGEMSRRGRKTARARFGLEPMGRRLLEAYRAGGATGE